MDDTAQDQHDQQDGTDGAGLAVTEPDGDRRRPWVRRRGPVLVGSTLMGAAALAVAATVAGAARGADSTATSALSTRTNAASYQPTTGTSTSGTVASSVEAAVVDIVSTEKYRGATAAGTGMILTSTGEILTNNHVIDGATSIRVTVVATGRSYAASVVGTDPTQDVAVLQLVGASGLRTVPLGNSSAVRVGQTVIASGNAGGTGGTPSSVTGTVVAVQQSITASDEGGSDAEQLTGLIETNAPIVAGDSGGPLTISGRVVGIDTAASASSGQSGYSFGGGQADATTTTTSQSYAIPIATALTIAQQIEAGQASSTIHIGTQGFLGVEVADQSTGDSSQGVYGMPGYGSIGGFSGGGFSDGFGGGFGSFSGGVTSGGITSGGATSGGTTSSVSGATLSGVVAGGAAESAGLAAGDVITSVNGKTVTDADALSSLMTGTKAGQKVTLGWTDSVGTKHTATVTLDPAPAD